MKKRILISCIIGIVWVFLLIVVLRTPMEWPVHEGKMHSSTQVVHLATGVSADTPLLCVEIEEKLAGKNYTSTATEGYMPDDVQIDSLLLADKSPGFCCHLCHSFQVQLLPLQLSADCLRPQEGWSVQEIEGNKVSLRHKDGSTVSYTYSCLPQRATVYYSGERSGNALEIDEYYTENHHYAYAIEDKKAALEASYSIYRDGFEGFVARVAFCFLSCFGGTYLLFPLAPRFTALIRFLLSHQTQKQ